MEALKDLSKKRISPKLEKSLYELRQTVTTKNKIQHENNLNKRTGSYPEFTRPELLPQLGKELTNDIRKNFDKLVNEGRELSASGKLPEKQIEELRKFVFSHRIFQGTTRDHDRSRLEFETKKHNIINKWEKEYKRSWPTYQNDVITDNNLAIKAGKMVSRHHFLPVRSLIINDTPENNKLLEKGIVNLKNDRLSDHYPVNAHWNMIPSKAPGDHTDKIHGDNSAFSKIFGPIKLDYHYEQVGEDSYKSIVPPELKEKSIPLFVKEYDFYLDKLEEKTGVSIPEKQRQLAVDYLTTYANEYPDNKELTAMKNSQQGTYIYRSLIKPFKPSYNKHTLKEEKSFPMRKWEKERGEKWPVGKEGKLAEPTFLIQPYSKISKPQWWLYQPDLNSVPRQKTNTKKRH